MIRTPDDWPLWPVLPMKRRSQDGTWPEMGFIVDHRGTETIWLGTIYEINTILKADGPKKVYESAEDLVADSWIVD